MLGKRNVNNVSPPQNVLIKDNITVQSKDLSYICDMCIRYTSLLCTVYDVFVQNIQYLICHIYHTRTKVLGGLKVKTIHHTTDKNMISKYRNLVKHFPPRCEGIVFA